MTKDFNHPVATTATQAENRELRAEIERLRFDLADKTELVVDLRAEIERLQDENTCVVTELVESEIEIERLRHRIVTLEGMLGEMNIAVPE